MPLKESEAIVLRSFPLGEGDRLVSFLDRQAGRVRGVARGAQASPRAALDRRWKCSRYIRIWYFERENGDLVRINQCELIESFMDVQARLSRRESAWRWSAKLRKRFWGARSSRRAVPVDSADGPRDSRARPVSSGPCVFLPVDCDGSAGGSDRSTAARSAARL